MTKRNIVLFIVILTLSVGGIFVTKFIVHIAEREKERANFSGCNLLFLSNAKFDINTVEIYLNLAGSNTNTTPEQIEELNKQLKEAKVRCDKWDRHVKKFGHLHGDQ